MWRYKSNNYILLTDLLARQPKMNFSRMPNESFQYKHIFIHSCISMHDLLRYSRMTRDFICPTLEPQYLVFMQKLWQEQNPILVRNIQGYTCWLLAEQTMLVNLILFMPTGHIAADLLIFQYKSNSIKEWCIRHIR